MSEQQWTDERIVAKAEKVPLYWNEKETTKAIAETMRELRDEMQAEIVTLRQQNRDLMRELAMVLDVAIARGVELGYEDANYHERYRFLSGMPWIDGPVPPEGDEE